MGITCPFSHSLSCQNGVWHLDRSQNSELALACPEVQECLMVQGRGAMMTRFLFLNAGFPKNARYSSRDRNSSSTGIAFSRCVTTHPICLQVKQDVSACQIYGACSPSIMGTLKGGALLPKDVPAGMLRGKQLPRENDFEEETNGAQLQKMARGASSYRIKLPCHVLQPAHILSSSALLNGHLSLSCSF